jgi:2,3-bisphosphoglycerate-dependent phosphoglycerate mutase
MNTLVLLRHGETDWDSEDRFVGWTDIDLSIIGRQQATETGRILQREGFTFDIAYTSVLKRAIRTVWIVLEEMDRMWIPIHSCWELNARHYGALQGLKRTEIATTCGDEQLTQWERGYDVRPPKLEAWEQSFPAHDPRYRHLRPDQLPQGESRKDVACRLWSCWQRSIAVSLRQHQSVLVVAHEETLQIIVKYLDGLSDADVVRNPIRPAVPLVYLLKPDLNPLQKYQLDAYDEFDPVKPLLAAT